MLDAGKAVAPDQGADRVLVQGRREAPGIELAALAPGAGRVVAVGDRVLQADRSPEDPVRVRRTARALDMDRTLGAGLTPPGQDRARDMERDQAPVPDMDQDRVLDMDQDPAITDRDPVLAPPRASVVSRGARQF